MNLILINEEHLRNISTYLADEFRSLVSRINTGWLIEHNEDGTHAAVTAESLDVAGDAMISGDADVNGDFSAADGMIEASATMSGGTGTGTSGPGIRLKSTAGGEDWALIVSRDNFDDSIGLYDTTNGVEVLKLYRTGANTYLLAPSEDGIATVNLGEQTDNDLRFDKCVAAIFYERNDAGLGYYTAIAHAAGNFTASAGTWGVDAADQQLYRYTIVGKKVTVAWSIVNSDVSAGSVLRLALPAGVTAAATMNGFHEARDAGGAAAIATCRVVSGQTYIEIYPTVGTGGTWTITAADNTATTGQLTFEMQ